MAHWRRHTSNKVQSGGGNLCHNSLGEMILLFFLSIYKRIGPSVLGHPFDSVAIHRYHSLKRSRIHSSIDKIENDIKMNIDIPRDVRENLDNCEVRASSCDRST